jgi:hypothetical protein
MLSNINNNVFKTMKIEFLNREYLDQSIFAMSIA